MDIQTDSDESGNALARYDYEVRADGKRTGLEEAVWLTDDDNDGITEATDGDGVQQEEELDKTSYDWDYDAAGRLTDEAITHFDAGVSQAERFEYDLTGNRTELEKDTGYTGTFSPDQVFSYTYNANDQLTEEILDDLVDDANDRTTTDGYTNGVGVGTTQQHSKTITASGQLVSKPAVPGERINPVFSAVGIC